MCLAAWSWTMRHGTSQLSAVRSPVLTLLVRWVASGWLGAVEGWERGRWVCTSLWQRATHAPPVDQLDARLSSHGLERWSEERREERRGEEMG